VQGDLASSIQGDSSSRNPEAERRSSQTHTLTTVTGQPCLPEGVVSHGVVALCQDELQPARPPTDLACSTCAVCPRGVDPTARKRVDTAPAAGDIEQLQMANGAGQGGVDQQVLADRLQAEHRAQ
jgi:hypothetical protein